MSIHHSTSASQTNGSHGDAAPSTNGSIGAPAPSANGANGVAPPVANGAAPSPNGANGRDTTGRFARGNAGGPGNPFARRVTQLRQVLLAAVSDEDLRAIALKLVDQAKEGDVPSAKLLLAYAIGRPASFVEPDAIDVHEMQTLARQSVPVETLDPPLAGIPVSLASTVLREAQPERERQLNVELGRILRVDLPSGKKHRRPR